MQEMMMGKDRGACSLQRAKKRSQSAMYSYAGFLPQRRLGMTPLAPPCSSTKMFNRTENFTFHR